MKNVYENINQILSDWNPIGVPENIAIEEYRSYVPVILKSIVESQDLMGCLESILINKMQIDYNPKDNEQYEILKRVHDKIIKIVER